MGKAKGSEVIQCPNYAWRLFKRGDTYYADGRKHNNAKKSLGVENRKDAIRELQLLDEQTAIESNDSGEPTGNSPIPLSATKPFEHLQIEAGWQLYIKRRTIPIHLGGLKPSSVRKYRGHMKRFVSYCKENRVLCWSKVDRELLEDYAKSIDSTLAPLTIHDDLTMEISVSNWLIKNKQIPFDCKIDWKLQKPPGAEQYCYERDEVRRMLELALAKTRHPWIHQLIFLLSHTGVRISEAINLKWSDVDLKKEVIHIRDETFKKQIEGQQRRLVKDKESRIIPIHDALLKCIGECKRNSNYFIPGKDGRKRNYNHTREAFVKQIIEPLAKEFPTPEGELGFKDGRFHSFRHFFVSECFDAGVPECDIKNWVGHSESKIIALYRHIRSQTAKANMRLGKFGAE